MGQESKIKGKSGQSIHCIVHRYIYPILYTYIPSLTYLLAYLYRLSNIEYMHYTIWETFNLRQYKASSLFKAVYEFDILEEHIHPFDYSLDKLQTLMNSFDTWTASMTPLITPLSSVLHSILRWDMLYPFQVCVDMGLVFTGISLCKSECSKFMDDVLIYQTLIFFTLILE